MLNLFETIDHSNFNNKINNKNIIITIIITLANNNNRQYSLISFDIPYCDYLIRVLNIAILLTLTFASINKCDLQFP